jgi:hypothetical protein
VRAHRTHKKRGWAFPVLASLAACAAAIGAYFAVLHLRGDADMFSERIPTLRSAAELRANAALRAQAPDSDDARLRQ